MSPDVTVWMLCCSNTKLTKKKRGWGEEGLTPILYIKLLYNFAQEMFSKLQLFIARLVFWIYYTDLENFRKQIQWADDLYSDFNSFLTDSCLWFKLKNYINCQCYQDVFCGAPGPENVLWQKWKERDFFVLVLLSFVVSLLTVEI